MDNNVVQMNTQNPSAGAASAAPVNAIQGSNLKDVRQDIGAFYIGDFDGKQRYIRYDLNAFAEMEDRFGTMEEAQKRLEAGSMKDVRTILWLGLIWDETETDPITGDLIKYNISEFKVGSWLHTLNMKDVMEKLQQAITGSLPDEGTNSAVTNAIANEVPNNPN